MGRFEGGDWHIYCRVYWKDIYIDLEGYAKRTRIHNGRDEDTVDSGTDRSQWTRDLR